MKIGGLSATSPNATLSFKESKLFSFVSDGTVFRFLRAFFSFRRSRYLKHHIKLMQSEYGFRRRTACVSVLAPSTPLPPL